MYVLVGKIEIGDFVFNTVHDVEITRSVETMTDTAVIKLPLKFKVRENNEQKYTEEAIKVGDTVKITLAYEGKYEGVEFEGYVVRINPKMPLEIICEDAMWLLRRKSISRDFENVKMKEILQEVVKGTPIKLSERIPDVTVQKYTFLRANGMQVLESLRRNYSMSIFLEDDGRLYCGLQEATNLGQRAIYDLNYSLTENNLEFKTTEDRKIKVRYVYVDKENKNHPYEFGDPDGELRVYYTSVVSNPEHLEAMAKAELEKLKYEGFQGDLTSFLIPFVTRGMAVEIRDSEHKNREGVYFVKGVVTTFGISGARRKVTLGNKL